MQRAIYIVTATQIVTSDAHPEGLIATFRAIQKTSTAVRTLPQTATPTGIRTRR